MESVLKCALKPNNLPKKENMNTSKSFIFIKVVTEILNFWEWIIEYLSISIFIISHKIIVKKVPDYLFLIYIYNFGAS